jgi:serine O-acetyltransferase
MKRMMDSDWSADVQRYDMRRPFLKEQSIWAVWTYRLGRRIDSRTPGRMTRVLTAVYWPWFRLVETVVGISLPKSAVIGGGLRIWHFGGIFVHPETQIGRNCTLRQGVTIGNRVADGAVPVIGDDVEFGAYAQVLGAVRIGNGCRIGAMSVVLCDVPDGATAVGVPARIVGQTEVVSLQKNIQEDGSRIMRFGTER